MQAIVDTAIFRALTAIGELTARLSEERGQDLMEYAILTGLVAVVAAGAFAAVFLAVGANPFDTMATKIKDCVTFSTSCGV